MLYYNHKMLLGAHVSASGGVKNAIKNAEELGVEHIQTFLSAPQSYKITDLADKKVKEFRQIKSHSKVKSCYAHAIYLLNFASEKPENIELSRQNLIQTLNLSAKVQFNGVIIHLGSTKEGIRSGIEKVGNQIKSILGETDPNSTLLLENSAGAGNFIGSKYEDILELININKGNPRLKVCIDTQHSFAAGYDIRNKADEVIDSLLSLFGSELLSVVHLNDSKTTYNSKRDRHENIGEGEIGYTGLKIFCTDARLRSTTFILEVPGFEGKGPDKRNLEIVRSFFN